MSDEWKRNPNPTEFLHETGLLYRINREIMHPLGLTLSIAYPDDPATVANQSAQVDVFSVDDAEGVTFSDDTILSAQARVDDYMESIGKKRLELRHMALGYAIQPMPKKA